MSDEPPDTSQQHTLHEYGHNTPGPQNPDPAHKYLVTNNTDLGTQTTLHQYEHPQ